MFQLDDKFLAEIGLADLPEDQKKAFIQHIYGELEVRVGEKLTDGMSDNLLDEFGYFADMDVDKMKAWFSENLPDFATREDYKEMAEANSDASEGELMSEYGAMKWLQLNRPDYPDVVASVLAALKEEIRNNKDAILGGVQG